MKIIDSGIKFTSNKEGGNNPQEIVIHHAEASSCSVYDIDRWHKERGWCGIGYHYFIDKQGNIYTGRPESWTGAHCVGHNHTSIGICLEGRLGVENVTQQQYNSLIELVEDIHKRRGKLPIYGHKELNQTDCPANFPLDKFRRDVERGETTGTDYVENATVINVSSKLNVRKTPNGEIIGYLFPNERLQVNWVDRDYLGWYRITYKITGTSKLKNGYVSSKYIKKD